MENQQSFQFLLETPPTEKLFFQLFLDFYPLQKLKHK